MKVVYINKETGKEVHYGDSITIKESGKFDNGYSYHSETTLPIINDTIPDLIKKGVLVQKEVKDNKEASESKSEFTIEKKIGILTEEVKMLIEKVDKLEEYLYNLYNYD